MISKIKNKRVKRKSVITDQVYIGDARQIPALLKQYTSAVDTIITSPPYGNLKDYKVRNQLGYGQSWDDYLRDLIDIFRSCYSLLKDTGSMWVVVDAWRDSEDYRLLPLELANNAKPLGWKLQDIIIWDKQHTLPFYRVGQFQPVYEYILFFTKTNRFKFHRDRIREVDGLSMWWVDFPERFNPQGKSPTNIWQFPLRPQGAWRGTREAWRHDCPFPTELVARIIELTTNEGDVVLDPFAGSGVVLATAAAMKRHYLGVEINPFFVSQFNLVVKDEIEGEWKELVSKRKVMQGLNGTFSSLILRLRALKYARKVTAAISSKISNIDAGNLAAKLKLHTCICITDIPTTFEPGDILDVSLYYLLSGSKKDFDRLRKEINNLLNEFPLGHYRINPTIKGFSRKADLKKALSRNYRLYLYSRSKIRTYQSVHTVEKWFKSEAFLSKSDIVPILSNLRVDVAWMADSYGDKVLSSK